VKAALTGATGFVGSHLAAALVARGDAVTALVRRPEKAKGLADRGVRLVPGALEDDAALRVLAEGSDVLYHVAGALTATSPGGANLTNVNREGTERVTRAAKDAGVGRLVYVSSLAASGPAVRGTPLPDTACAAPVTDYGRSKLAGEEIVRAAGVPFTIVRPPSVYGPRDTQFLPAFRAVRAGLAPVMGDGLQELSFVHVRDLAEALVAAGVASATAGRTYHAAHPEIVSQREFIQAVAKAMGKNVRVVPLSRPIVMAILYGVGAVADLFGSGTVLRPGKAPEFFAPAWTCGSQPLATDAGWTARIDLAQGLPETAQWYREAGWL
jgi:dihydroflavonol-4-reductase